MAYRAGEILVDVAFVTDALGAPSTEDPSTVFSSSSAYAPDDTPIVVTIEAGGGPGMYTISFITYADQPGTYSFVGISSETGMEYVGSWDVDAATIFTGVTGITLGEFRVRLGDTFGDHIRLTATVDSSPGTFTDANNLTESENAYMNSHALMISAQNLGNIGLVRRVRASSGISNTLTMEEFPADIFAGDILDLYNLGGHGFRPQFYDSQIRNAVELSYPAALIPISVASAAPFDADTRAIALDAAFVAVWGVTYDNGDFMVDVRPNSRQHGEWGSGWWIDTAARILYVDGMVGDDMDGTAYTVHGYARHVPPVSDADLISLETTWLLYRVASMMAATRLVDARWNNWAIEYGRLEQAERGNIWTPRKPNTVFL